MVGRLNESDTERGGTMAAKSLVKILFELEAGWHGYETETLWAEPVGGERYRLRNSPFFAFGVSAEDIVFARSEDGVLRFKGVSIAGGHSTYRIVLADVTRDDVERFLRPLAELGCTYEEGKALAVDVPPAANIYQVYSLLEAGEARGLWEFDEGNCRHPIEVD